MNKEKAFSYLSLAYILSGLLAFALGVIMIDLALDILQGVIGGIVVGLSILLFIVGFQCYKKSLDYNAWSEEPHDKF